MAPTKDIPALKQSIIDDTGLEGIVRYLRSRCQPERLLTCFINWPDGRPFFIWAGQRQGVQVGALIQPRSGAGDRPGMPAFTLHSQRSVAAVWPQQGFTRPINGAPAQHKVHESSAHGCKAYL